MPYRIDEVEKLTEDARQRKESFEKRLFRLAGLMEGFDEEMDPRTVEAGLNNQIRSDQAAGKKYLLPAYTKDARSRASVDLVCALTKGGCTMDELFAKDLSGKTVEKILNAKRTMDSEFKRADPEAQMNFTSELYNGFLDKFNPASLGDLSNDKNLVENYRDVRMFESFGAVYENADPRLQSEVINERDKDLEPGAGNPDPASEKTETNRLVGINWLTFLAGKRLDFLTAYGEKNSSLKHIMQGPDANSQIPIDRRDLTRDAATQSALKYFLHDVAGVHNFGQGGKATLLGIDLVQKVRSRFPQYTEQLAYYASNQDETEVSEDGTRRYELGNKLQQIVYDGAKPGDSSNLTINDVDGKVRFDDKSLEYDYNKVNFPDIKFRYTDQAEPRHPDDAKNNPRFFQSVDAIDLRNASEKKEFTDSQLMYGHMLYQNSHMDDLFDARTRTLMDKIGINKYDCIFINGKSMNELYPELRISPADIPDVRLDREHKLQAHLAAAGLYESKNITFTRPEGTDENHFSFASPKTVKREQDQKKPIKSDHYGFGKKFLRVLTLGIWKPKSVDNKIKASEEKNLKMEKATLVSLKRKKAELTKEIESRKEAKQKREKAALGQARENINELKNEPLGKRRVSFSQVEKKGHDAGEEHHDRKKKDREAENRKSGISRKNSIS